MNEQPKLNKNGNRRGMSPNSRKNLDMGRKGNNHAKKDISITPIQRGMIGELCPYAKDPTWTWGYAIAEAEMRDAMINQRARDSIKERLEGKVSLPIEGSLEITETRELTDEELAIIAATNIVKNHARRGSHRASKEASGS